MQEVRHKPLLVMSRSLQPIPTNLKKPYQKSYGPLIRHFPSRKRNSPRSEVCTLYRSHGNVSSAKMALRHNSLAEALMLFRLGFSL